jgi:hypothetical protein
MQSLQAEMRTLTKEDLIYEVISHYLLWLPAYPRVSESTLLLPFLFFRATPKGGNVICGKFIPEQVRRRSLPPQTMQSCILTTVN